MDVSLSEERGWYRDEDTFVVGDVFYQGDHYRDGGLAELFRENIVLDDGDVNKEFIRYLKGFYAAVIGLDKYSFLLADHIRFYPLYYAHHNNKTIVSDNPEKITETRKNLGSINKSNYSEKLVAGYVSGKSTIFSSIYQIQAGEIIRINKKKSEFYRERVKYLLDDYNPLESEDQQEKKTNSVLTAIASRLIEKADGRPIIIGLSAGWDSRLIAMILADCGYENLYAYHEERSKERTEIVQKVTDDLGIPLSLYELQHSDFKNTYDSHHWEMLNDVISGSSQRFPNLTTAVRNNKLKSDPEIPDEGIVVTGQTVGAVTKYVRGKWVKRSSHNMVHELINAHYDYANYYKINSKYDVSECINSTFSDLNTLPDSRPLYNYLRFVWQDREVKRRVADPYEYQYWGYDHWVPLWDVEYMDLSNTVPLEKRGNKEFIHRLTEKNYKEKYSRFPTPNPHNTKKKSIFFELSSKIANSVYNTRLYHPFARSYFGFRDFNNMRDAEQIYKGNSRYGFITVQEFLNRYNGHEHYHYFETVNKYGSLGQEHGG